MNNGLSWKRNMRSGRSGGRRFTPPEKSIRGKVIASLLSLSMVATMSIGTALITAPAAAAAPIATVGITAAVSNHEGTNSSGTQAVGDAWNNCVTYQPADTSTGTSGNNKRYTSTNFVATGNEAQTGHGYDGSCPTGNNAGSTVNTSKQSVVGIAPAASATVTDGVLFNLARITHYNNPVNTTADYYKGELKIKLSGFDESPELTFPWSLWETVNSSNSCPSGHWFEPGNCQDQIKFTSQISDVELKKDGLRYKLVIGGFISSNSTSCPVTPTGTAINDFWTNESKSTNACIYASVVQIRELTVNKVTAGINPPSQAFDFTSTGTLDGSAWKAGKNTVTPTAVGTGVEVFKKELLRSDKVTITEGAVTDPRWALTSMACTQTNALGVSEPLPAGVSVSGRTLTLQNIGAAPNPQKPNITCTVTNTFTSGSLTIAKVLDDPDQGLADANKVYNGTYNCGDGNKDFSLNAGQSKTYDRIPVGATCVVKETEPTGNLLNGSYAWGTPTFAPSNSVKIQSGVDAKVTITNHIVQNKGTFTVAKKVVGPEGGFINPERKFEVAYSCVLGASTLPVASGTLSVTMNRSVTSEPIPSGASCVLTETLAKVDGDFADETSYEWVGSTGVFAPASPIIIGGANSNETVTLTNTYKRNFGLLKITKKVEGPAGAFTSSTMDFTGTYTCGDGVARDFTVKANGEFTSPADTIPAGSSCTVIEKAPAGGLLNSSYQWAAATYAPGNGTVKVAKDATATVEITNHIVQNTGKFSIKKTVTGPVGDSGYTGNSTRSFTVDYKCTPDNGASIAGKLTVTTAAVTESPAIPAGYSCVLSEPNLVAQTGDFADGSYEWVTPTAASFTPSNTVTIGNNTTTALTLDNKYTRSFGSLNLKKVIDGAGYIGTGAQFEVKYDCGGTYKGAEKLTAGDANGVTVTGLPANAICELEEIAPSNTLLDPAHKWGTASWSATNAAVTIKKNDVVEATVTNHTIPIFGAVTVVKKVDGGGVNNAVVFDLTVVCDNGYTATFSNLAGVSSSASTLPVGTSCTIDEGALPTGEGIFVDDSYTWNEKPAPQTVKITEEAQVVNVTVTNTTKRVYGSLLVKKTLVDPDGVYAGAPNSGAPFSGTWSCTYGQTPSGNGTWTAVAGANAAVAGSDILLGSSCKVLESALTTGPSTDTSYSWGAPTLSPDGGVVVLSAANPNGTVNVTNTINRSTGLFSVAKGVSGPLEGFPENSEFPFSWVCAKDTWAGANGTFKLANGASWDGPGAGTAIPSGATCTVTEDSFPAANPSYTWDSVAFAATGPGANGSQSGKSFTFTVPASTEAAPKPIHIVATNTLSQKFGSVTVTKTVDAGYDTASGYKFTIRLNCGTNGAFFTEVLGGASSTIGNIPLGSECAVSEDTRNGGLVDGSYVWEPATFTPSTVTISQVQTPIAVTVHNPTKRVYGALLINKVLTGQSSVVDPTRDYTGTWQCVYGTDAPVTGTWTVKAGATTEPIGGMLVGSSCTIATEGALAAPNADPSYVWAAPVFSAASTVSAAAPATLSVTNEVKRNTGSILITKKISGETAGLKADQTFNMNYSCSAEGVTGTMTGQVPVSPDAETTLLDNVPFGWSCAISEGAPTSDQLKDASYSWGTVTGAPNSVVLASGNNPAKVTVTNEIVRNLGSVKLQKIFTGPTGIVPDNKVYSGTFTCSYAGTVIKTGDWSTTAGAPAISLATDLPLTTTCTATEIALGAPSADPSYTWNAAKFSIATVGPGDAAVVDVTNTLVRNLGSLTVSKAVTGSESDLAGYTGKDAKNFTVNYSCAVPGQAGIPAITGSTTLANGETATLADKNIPFGWSCSFTEATPHQDTLADSSFAWGPATITPATATLSPENTKVAVHVENPIVRVKGAVQVSKVLTGPDNAGAVDSNRDYTGNWSCTYGTGANAVVVDGKWTTKAGSAATIVSDSDGVLLNSECVITEDELSAPVPNDPSYRWVSAVASNDTVEIGSPANLVMTNTFTRDSGSFSVVKKIDGLGYTGGTEAKNFTVNYNCGVGLSGTLTLAEDGTATVDGIPAQRECTLSEDLPQGNLEAAYKWIPGTWSENVVDGKITIARDTTTTATITNHTEKIFGTVSVVKELAGSGGVVQGKEFTVNVTCSDGYSGQLTMEANAAAKATSQIAVGSTCEVKETTPTGGLIDGSYGWGATPEAQTVTITAENQVVPVTITNTTERRYGTLSIAKVLVDPDNIYPGGNFAGTWACTYGQGAGAVVKNGEWSIKAGEAAAEVGTQILLGSSCHVAENDLSAHPTDDTSYIWAPSYAPGQDVVLTTSDPNGAVTVTNTITRLTGSFAVTKQLGGSGVANGVVPGSTFDFSYKCSGTGWAGAEGNFTLTPRSGSWNPAEVIPAGASCTVTEKEEPATTGPAFTWDGVDFAVTGSAASAVTDERSVTFTIPTPVDGAVQTVGVVATNSITEKFGDVVVTKKLAGATQGYDGKQTFDITLNCENATPQTLTMTAVAGSNSKSVQLPLGTKCTVAEAALGATTGLLDTSFAWTNVDITNSTFTVSSQTTAIAVDVTNTIGRVTGSVDVTKKLNAPAGVIAVDKLFTGSWSCTYMEEPAVTGTWSVKQGATSVPVSDILLNSECVVTEDAPGAPSDDPSYRWTETTLEGATVTTADTTAHLIVTNNLVRDTGIIKATKKVTGAIGGFTGGDSAVFEIAYLCTVDGVPTPLTGSAKVANGETVTLSGSIPMGWNCAISEVQPTGNLMDGSFAWDTAKISQPAVVLSAETPTVTVDVENPIKRVYGAVQVEKVVTGPAADKVASDREFSGSLVCTYGTDEAVVKDWKATTTTSALATDILVGSSCVVTETAPVEGPVADDPSMVWLPAVLPANVSVVAGEIPAIATVTNPTEQLFSDFSITKTVTGATNGVAVDGQYNFTWSCTTSGFMAPITGSATIANGELWQLPSVVQIPRGSVCTVTEDLDGRPDTIDGAYNWDLVEYTVTGAIGQQEGPATTFTVPTDDTKVLVTAANPITRSYGEFSVSKSSDPVSGSQLKIGQKVTYTLTAVNTSEVPVHDVVLSDDLASVLAATSLVGSVQQTQGSSSIESQLLSWDLGTLAAGETQTLTYTVQVNEGSENKTITNMVLGSADVPPTSCAAAVPAARSMDSAGQTPSAQATCGTTHTVVPPTVPPTVTPTVPPTPVAPPLASTGVSGLWFLGLGTLLLAGGVGVMVINRRREQRTL